MMSKYRKEDSIKRATRKSKVAVTDEEYNKMDNFEKSATLLSLTNEESHRFSIFQKDKTRVITTQQPIAVASEDSQSYMIDLSELGRDLHYWRIQLMCVLFIPTLTKTRAIMKIYMKNDAYKDDELKREPLGEAPMSNMFSAIYSMNHYMSIDDRGALSLHIQIDNNDIVNAEVGQIKIHMKVVSSNNNITYQHYPAVMHVYSPFTEADGRKEMFEQLIKALNGLFNSKKAINQENAFVQLVSSREVANSYGLVNVEREARRIEPTAPLYPSLGSRPDTIEKARSFLNPN